ncbi:YJL132W [Kluyveromyces marxianus]|uniref:YJL132W n=1 Tax=Kluyveromyces marxianus TaxID=4911 RepID=A0ABX6F587_KLUMA|nr:YJL132W [Kluyveromyces marxianus]
MLTGLLTQTWNLNHSLTPSHVL